MWCSKSAKWRVASALPDVRSACRLRHTDFKCIKTSERTREYLEMVFFRRFLAVCGGRGCCEQVTYGACRLLQLHRCLDRQNHHTNHHRTPQLHNNPFSYHTSHGKWIYRSRHSSIGGFLPEEIEAASREVDDAPRNSRGRSEFRTTKFNLPGPELYDRIASMF